MYLFPTAAVTRLDTNSSDMMAFIVSGGVTEIPALARPAAPPGGDAAAAPLA